MIAAATTAHLEVLGLGRIPFPTTPDASCYFHTPTLEAEMAEAVHCVLSRKGFVLITGEVGLGKSTFVRRLTETVIANGCVVAFVLNTFLHGAELLRAINHDFGLKPGDTFADDVACLNEFLVEQHQRGGTALIIVDDAQNLCLESLELLRMLSNFETNQEKLVQILLAGQPELTDKLADNSIRQLTSRIVKHVQLRPLDLGETANYVNFRLTSAGAEGRIAMPTEALRVLHRHAAGNPRRMHLILDRCLYGLVALRTRSITPELVQRAAEESGVRSSLPALRKRRTALVFGAALASLATVVAASVLTRNQDIDPLPATNAEAAVSSPAAAAESPHTSRSQTIAQCLQRFGLDDDGRRFERWLRAGDTLALREEVQRQRPDVTAMAAPATLAIASGHSDACALTVGETKVLLWRPAVAFGDFTLGASGESVAQLQKALASTGQYNYRLDGLAGRRTVIAIADFQRSQGLEATGYPDALTRFVIEQKAGTSSPGTL